MAAKPGRLGLIKVTGAGLAFTGEACTTISANTVYQITNTVKQVWDRSAAITVLKDAVSQSSALYTLNRLTGTITFLADIGGGHTITVTGTYLPVSTAAQAKTYSYALSANNLDVTKFGDTLRTRIQGMKDIKGSANSWKVDTYFTDALNAAVPIVLEFWIDTNSTFDMRAWAMLDNATVQSVLTGAVDVPITFVGAADADGRTISG